MIPKKKQKQKKTNKKHTKGVTKNSQYSQANTN